MTDPGKRKRPPVAAVPERGRHAPEHGAAAETADRASSPVKIPMGERIKKYRKEAKISQQSLAGRLHVTRNTVINWESGKYRPDADLFPSLCGILGISLNDLYGIAPGPDDSLSVREKNLVRRYRGISPVGRRIVDRMLDDILEEESLEKTRILDGSAIGVAVLATKAAAGDGFDYSDIPVEDYRFVYRSRRNEKADAVIRVKGDSMLPVYRENDWVYVQFADSAAVGEDVICASPAGMHIKRLGENGPCSLNRDVPFTLTAEDDHVRIAGRVLGIVDPADIPGEDDQALLAELRRDEVRAFREKHGLD